MKHAITRNPAIIPTLMVFLLLQPSAADHAESGDHSYNGPYTGDYLNRIAFPIGGIGAGMFCVEGSGALSHMSVRHRMDFFHEPCVFAAISVETNSERVTKVLEGPVPSRKVFGAGGTGKGASGSTFGLPRFDEAEFIARFPFARIHLHDKELPLKVTLTGWSPFVPGNPDDSSLPVGALEYRFTNTGDDTIQAVFSYHARNFMAVGGRGGDSIRAHDNGFILRQAGNPHHPEHEGEFAFFIEDGDVAVDHCWYKGGWWDAMTLVWKNVSEGRTIANPPVDESSPGASLYQSFTLRPKETHTIRLLAAWYVPKTTLRHGEDPAGPAFGERPSRGTGPRQQEVTGFVGKGLINTYDPFGDEATGTLTSPAFEITHKYVQFLIGGGNHAGKTCMQLLIGDDVVREATGRDSEQLKWTTWDVADLKGKQARIRVVDGATGSWGHVNVDQIVLTDRRWPDVDTLMSRRSAWGRAVRVLNDFEGADFGDWVVNRDCSAAGASCCPDGNSPGTAQGEHHVPWYAGRFRGIDDVAEYWRTNYQRLRRESAAFRDAFYDTTLPPEVVEAVAANLTILKSPTVLRQTDGRLWCYEGCGDRSGCCPGSCTHVWNYAQAIPHLFPQLERSLRRTEFCESQDDRGHQTFRAGLPIRPVKHTFHAAADGQLGGIMKVYREWRISGDSDWLRTLWPRVRASLDYCITTWDPRGRGVLEEPHHNTYDIEFWGPDSHGSSIYLGALTAAVEMGTFLGDDMSKYEALRDKGRRYLETELFNGAYFIQRVQTEGLYASFEPLAFPPRGPYKSIIAAVNAEGPKYQYAGGCLSDGVLGFWLAHVCGLDADIAAADKIKSHLAAIHKHNLRHDLSDHANPQRPAFALGRDGGLLLCTWPHGDKPILPFIYSDEVWTGIEYQVASHMMIVGMVDEGLEIVRVCRDRYDGTRRNPFDEYECGHWYGRAQSSYALLQGLTGARYDAVDKTLYIDSRVGDSFRSFLCTASGFGTVGLDAGQPFLEVKHGHIEVKRVIVSGRRADANSSSADAPPTAASGSGR